MSSFLTYKNASGRDFLITQNVRDSAVFFIPLPLNFWPLLPAPATFRSRDFCVHSFKHSNIVYNFGASGSRYLYAVYLNIFEWAFALFTFTFDFVITHTLCKGSTSYKIRYLSMNSGSVEQQILKHGLFSHLSWFSTCDQSHLSVGCRVAKSAYFPQNWATFKLLPWVDFPSGLKVWNIAYITFDWNACIETFCILPMIKLSWTFTLTVPSWWNDLPYSIQAASP